MLIENLLGSKKTQLKKLIRVLCPTELWDQLGKRLSSEQQISLKIYKKITKQKCSSLYHFPENGQEQRRGGDHRWVLGDVPEGKYEIPPPRLSADIKPLDFFFKSHLQDENIMQSMHMFDNVI